MWLAWLLWNCRWEMLFWKVHIQLIRRKLLNLLHFSVRFSLVIMSIPNTSLAFSSENDVKFLYRYRSFRKVSYLKFAFYFDLLLHLLALLIKLHLWQFLLLPEFCSLPELLYLLKIFWYCIINHCTVASYCRLRVENWWYCNDYFYCCILLLKYE